MCRWLAIKARAASNGLRVRMSKKRICLGVSPSFSATTFHSSPAEKANKTFQFVFEEYILKLLDDIFSLVQNVKIEKGWSDEKLKKWIQEYEAYWYFKFLLLTTQVHGKISHLSYRNILYIKLFRQHGTWEKMIRDSETKSKQRRQ